MNQTRVATLAILLSAIAGFSTAEAQIMPNPDSGFVWDYRFDAQYNSTIKPYLRWYRREGNRNPANGIRYPYYHGPQPIYGFSMPGMPPSIIGYGQVTQPTWYNPYQLMPGIVPDGSFQGQDSQTIHQSIIDAAPIIQSSSSSSLRSPRNRSIRRLAWVKKDAATLTVLYVEPTAGDHGYQQAFVTTDRGRVTDVAYVGNRSAESLAQASAK